MDTIREITPAPALWRALHDPARADGPAEIRCAEDPIVRNVTFYLDDLGAELALVDRFRVAHRGGAATVELAGRYPFGAEAGVSQGLRYASNHVRGVTDLHLPAGTTVRRRLGVAGLFLPGRWRRFYCLPPCLHLAEGRSAAWQEIPADLPASGMIGHWHRPPLALVLERADGTRVEIGTGGDVWRWEKNLDLGPEAASYKLGVETDGVRFVREPLMTCTEVQPQPRVYRLTWYLAWTPPSLRSRPEPEPDAVPILFSPRGEALVRQAGGAASEPSLLLDMAQWPGPATARRASSPTALLQDRREPAWCWECATAQKAFRRIVRQLAALGPRGALVLRGLTPGPCWDPAHCERRGEPHAHWDMDALLGLGVWSRQQLGPGWQIRVEAPGWEALPSMTGLFAPTGFTPAEEGGADA